MPTHRARHGHQAALELGSWELGSSNVSKPKRTLPSPSHLKDIFKVLQKPYYTFYFSWGSLK